MVEKQKQLFNLLKEIDTICKNNGIEYVLAGGTLIGAMRHKGFIPWDDDVDIMMTRDNWDKLKEVAKTQLPPNRALLAPELDSEYTNGFPRYMDTSGTAIHTHQIPGRDRAGEIIDVFILDPIADDEESYRQYTEEMMLYSDLVNDAAVFSGRWEVSPWRYIKYKLTSLIRGKKYVLSKIEEKIFTYPEEKCNYYVMRWGGVPFRFDRRWYDKVKLAPFEDIMAMIPQAANEYLTWHFGDDWMYVPYVTERESHEMVSSTEVDYTTIQQEYLPRINVSKYLANSVCRKIIGMASVKKSHAYSTNIVEMQAFNQKIRCEKILSETGVSPEALTTELPVSTLADLFQEYFVFQLRKEAIGREDWKNIYRFNNPVLVELEPDYFYAAVHTLFHTNRIAKAKRLIDIWKQRHEMNEGIAQIENSIISYRRAANLFMDENKPLEAEKLVDDLLALYPDHISLWKLKLKICATIGNDEWKSIFPKCQEMWPEDGDFIKYQADFVLQNEGIQEAFPLYIASHENTSNGLIQLEIIDVIKSHLNEILSNVENNSDCEAIAECETITLLEELFCNHEDILKQIYRFKIRNTTDIRKVNSILSKMKKDECYSDTLKEAFLSLGVGEDAADWKLNKIYGNWDNGVKGLLKTVLAYKKEQGSDNISASIWKLIGDLYIKIGKDKDGIRYYRRASKSELCELERYEMYKTVSRKLWKGQMSPIRKTFKKQNSFLKWYQKLYTIPVPKEINNDEITTDTVSVAERDS